MAQPIDFSQDKLIDQFEKYMRVMRENDHSPSKRSDEEFEAYIDDMKVGVCHGLSVVYGYMAAQGYIDTWKTILGKILNFSFSDSALIALSPIQKSNLKDGNHQPEYYRYEELFEKVISYALYNQALALNEGEKFSQSDLLLPRAKYFFSEKGAIRSRISLPIKFSANAEKPKEILEQVAKLTPSETIILVHTTGHTCTLFFDHTDASWHFYDPNSQSLDACFYSSDALVTFLNGQPERFIEVVSWQTTHEDAPALVTLKKLQASMLNVSDISEFSTFILQKLFEEEGSIISDDITTQLRSSDQQIDMIKELLANPRVLLQYLKHNEKNHQCFYQAVIKANAVMMVIDWMMNFDLHSDKLSHDEHQDLRSKLHSFECVSNKILMMRMRENPAVFLEKMRHEQFHEEISSMLVDVAVGESETGVKIFLGLWKKDEFLSAISALTAFIQLGVKSLKKDQVIEALIAADFIGCFDESIDSSTREYFADVLLERCDSTETLKEFFSYLIEKSVCVKRVISKLHAEGGDQINKFLSNKLYFTDVKKMPAYTQVACDKNILIKALLAKNPGPEEWMLSYCDGATDEQVLKLLNNIAEVAANNSEVKEQIKIFAHQSSSSRSSGKDTTLFLQLLVRSFPGSDLSSPSQPDELNNHQEKSLQQVFLSLFPQDAFKKISDTLMNNDSVYKNMDFSIQEYDAFDFVERFYDSQAHKEQEKADVPERQSNINKDKASREVLVRSSVSMFGSTTSIDRVDPRSAPTADSNLGTK